MDHGTAQTDRLIIRRTVSKELFWTKVVYWGGGIKQFFKNYLTQKMVKLPNFTTHFNGKLKF